MRKTVCTGLCLNCLNYWKHFDISAIFPATFSRNVEVEIFPIPGSSRDVVDWLVPSRSSHDERRDNGNATFVKQKNLVRISSLDFHMPLWYDLYADWLIDLFRNDVKRSFQDDTRNLIGSAIMKVLFKPIKFRLTSRFPRLTSLWKRSIETCLNLPIACGFAASQIVLSLV